MRNKALAAGTRQWLRDLPGLIAQLEQEWSITVGRPYEDPTEAFVAEATLGDGTPAVLKLLIARPGNQAKNEITVLRLVGGAGCARRPGKTSAAHARSGLLAAADHVAGVPIRAAAEDR